MSLVIVTMMKPSVALRRNRSLLKAGWVMIRLLGLRKVI
nr:MAG TPA: hypothetical protein [Caudoviricetes sp.]